MHKVDKCYTSLLRCVIVLKVRRQGRHNFVKYRLNFTSFSFSLSQAACSSEVAYNKSLLTIPPQLKCTDQRHCVTPEFKHDNDQSNFAKAGIASRLYSPA